MAVTLSDLAIAVRVSGDGEDLSPAETAILTRILNAAVEQVDKVAPSAPDSVKELAIVQYGAYLHDMPVGRHDAYADAFVHSGAGAILARWR